MIDGGDASARSSAIAIHAGPPMPTMRVSVLALSLLSLAACGTTRGVTKPVVALPGDARLRDTLTGDFHGYWTGAASGTVLRAKDGGLLEIPVVVQSDLDGDVHWNMDATDFGELMLEKSGHYNSSVWFVATDIEVSGQ